MFLIKRPFFGRNRLPKASTIWQNQKKRRILQRSRLREKHDRHAISTSSERCRKRPQRQRKPESIGRPKRKRLSLQLSYWVSTTAKEDSIRSYDSRKRNSFSFEMPWSIPWPASPRILFGRGPKAARRPVLECIRRTRDRMLTIAILR